MQAATLKGLTEGEEDEDDDNREPRTDLKMTIWLAVLGFALGLSLLVNVVLSGDNARVIALAANRLPPKSGGGQCSGALAWRLEWAWS